MFWFFIGLTLYLISVRTLGRKLALYCVTLINEHQSLSIKSKQDFGLWDFLLFPSSVVAIEHDDLGFPIYKLLFSSNTSSYMTSVAYFWPLRIVVNTFLMAVLFLAKFISSGLQWFAGVNAR